jgi:hypothetical protein
LVLISPPGIKDKWVPILASDFKWCESVNDDPNHSRKQFPICFAWALTAWNAGRPERFRRTPQNQKIVSVPLINIQRNANNNPIISNAPLARPRVVPNIDEAQPHVANPFRRVNVLLAIQNLIDNERRNLQLNDRNSGLTLLQARGKLKTDL